MDAKPKLKLGQTVFFLIPKKSKNCRRKGNKYIVELGKIQGIFDDKVIIKTKLQSVHNRKIEDIYFSSVSAKKSGKL